MNVFVFRMTALLVEALRRLQNIMTLPILISRLIFKITSIVVQPYVWTFVFR